MSELWVCGEVHSQGDADESGNRETDWSFCGVFSSEELAVKACLGTNYFIGPSDLNYEWPEESAGWKGAYYPLELEENTRAADECD